MATVIVTMKVRNPKLRIKVAVGVCMFLRPFCLSIAAQEKIGTALMAWVQRGLHISVDEKRI